MNLAGMLQAGMGAVKDTAEAALWFRKVCRPGKGQAKATARFHQPPADVCGVAVLRCCGVQRLRADARQASVVAFWPVLLLPSARRFAPGVCIAPSSAHVPPRSTRPRA